MASASGYNHHRYARSLLKKSKKWEPSLTIQLLQHNWRFEGSTMLMTYDGPMKPLLLAIRAQVIPPSLIPFLYDIKPPVSFVDGCLVVEIQDLRRNPEVRSRVVMRPAPEALPQTIDVLLDRRGHGGDERLALELESRILSATSPPLYLGTSILAARNAVLALSLTAPAQPNLAADGSTRTITDTSLTSSSSDIERMRRLLRAGDRSSGASGSAPFQPSWSVLRAKERSLEIEHEKQREKAEQQAAAQAAFVAQQQQMQQQQQQQMQQQAGGGEGGQASGEKKKTKKKRPAPAPTAAEDEAETTSTAKKPKKKKTAAATAAAAAAAAEGAGAGGDKKGVAKIEPAATAGTNAGAAGAGVTPDKPKKQVKKKAKPAAPAATAAPVPAPAVQPNA